MGMAIEHGAIARDRVEHMNAVIDRSLGGKQVEKFPILELDPGFMDLMEHPWIVSACRRIVGDRFRFDHGFGLEQPTTRANLHGGPRAGQGAAFYDGHPNAAGAVW